MPEGWMVRARAERNLAPLANYQDISQDPGLALARLPGVTLCEGEEALGIYENTPGQLHETILVTTRGFHVYTGAAWNIVDYGDIQQVVAPETKEEIGGFTVGLADGHRVAIPILGAHQQFRDRYAFMTFLYPILHR